MNKIVLILLFFVLSHFAFSQNQIMVRGGYTSTNTSISEYLRGDNTFYYDSVTLDANVAFPSVNLDVALDMGKNFYFLSGLSYMRKGVESVYYENGGYWYEARQEYMGINIMLKYHHRFKDGKFGIYAAGGMRADFTVGGPNNAEITTEIGSEFFNAFGTFHPVEFVLPTVVGASYKFGPGEVLLDVNFLKGLSDVFPDRYVVGRTFTMGVCLGYSIYLN